MAIAFRAAGAKATDGTSPFSITPALPAGMVANDIVILGVVTENTGTASLTSDGSVTPWTAITGTPVSVTGGGKLYVWWGRWASGTTGPTITATTNMIIGATAAWSGCDTTSSVINNQATGTEATSDTSLSFATGISTTVNDCMVLLVATNKTDSNTAQYSSQANSNLGSVTERLDVNTNAGTPGGGFCIAEGTLATAGAIGTWTATLANNSPKVYLTLALQPPQNVTQDKTITAKARISDVVDKTITSLARVTGITNKTITAISRITDTVDKNITAIGRISNITDRTITSIARITDAVDQTINVRARITDIVDKTITAVANISTEVITDKTITALARIADTVDKTINSQARITDVVDKTIGAVARINDVVDRTIGAVAKVSVVVDKTISAQARITDIVDKTIDSRARIVDTVDKTIDAIARINILTDRTITALARITDTVDKTITSVANIAGGDGDGELPKRGVGYARPGHTAPVALTDDEEALKRIEEMNRVIQDFRPAPVRPVNIQRVINPLMEKKAFVQKMQQAKRDITTQRMRAESLSSLKRKLR